MVHPDRWTLFPLPRLDRPALLISHRPYEPF
jgi:hypothetical protein